MNRTDDIGRADDAGQAAPARMPHASATAAPPASASAADVLAQSVSRLLAGEPPITAPADLQARVWAEIERRGALPWWRRSVFDWPGPVRVACAVLGAPLVAAAIVVCSALPGAAAGLTGPGLRALLGLTLVLARSGAVLLHAIREYWLHGGLAVGGAAYAVLAALLALAWQLLIESPAPERPGVPSAHVPTGRPR